MPQPEDTPGGFHGAGTLRQEQNFAPNHHTRLPEASPGRPGEVWGSPVQEHNSSDFIPPGMDRNAYIAGERAAMAKALQLMLPTQQTLGMLSSSLQKLELRVHDEATHSRQTQLATADARSVVQGLNQRLEYLEKIRLPGMEGRLQHAIEAPLSQEFQATLMGLQDALNSVGSSSHHSPYTLSGFVVRQLTWLASTASLYAQHAISKADVAAIFLSRKILLDGRVAGKIESGKPEPTEASRSARAIIGAALFLAAVETCWQTHTRALKYVPVRVQKATAPAQLGLKVLRGATWAATLTLSAVYFRRACHTAADQAISGIDRALKRFPSLRPFSSPVESRQDGPPSPKEESAVEEDVEAACHPQIPPSPALRKQRSIFDTPPPSPPPSVPH